MPDLRSLIPLDAHQVRRLERLRELDPLASWGVDSAGEIHVDAGRRRYYGPTLHGAIGEALRALESAPRRYGLGATA